MAKYNEFSGKMSVGLFVEGHYLHVVCLAQQGNRLQLVDGQVVKMAKALETVKVQKEIFSDAMTDISDLSKGMGSEEIQDNHEETFTITEKDTGNYDNIEVLQRVLYQYPSKKFQMGIAIAEPQIYYMYFVTDWGLQGDKLKKRVMEEVSRERTE